MVTSKQLVVVFFLHAMLLWSKRDFLQCLIVLILWWSTSMSDFAKEMAFSSIFISYRRVEFFYIKLDERAVLFSMLLNQLFTLFVFFHWLTSVFFSISWLICSIIFLLILPSSFFCRVDQAAWWFVEKVIFVVF